MRKILTAVAIIVIVFGAVYMTGYTLPEKHSVTITDTIHAPKQEVYKRVRNIDDYALWQKTIRKTEVSAPGEWIEIGPKQDTVRYRMTVLEKNQRILRTIESENLTYGGHWIFRFEALNENATVLTVTENGEIKDPLDRFYAHFIEGYDVRVKAYVRSLDLSFGGV